MRVLVLAAVLILPAGCGRTPPPPPPPSKAPPPFPALPELKPADDFANDGFMELPAGDAAAFAWDLGEKVHHNYSFEQESQLVMIATAGAESAKIVSRTQWKGGAEVIGGGSGRGEVFFLSTPIGQWNNNQQISSEELNKVQKMIFRYPLRENGAFGPPQLPTSGQEDPKLVLFFALPSKEMKAGDKDSREVHLAHVLDDMKYHGRQEISHAGRRKVGRHECVKLLSRVDLEAIPPGDGNGRLIGLIASYFDPKEKRFVRVDAAFAVAVDIRREMRPADPKMESYWTMNRAQADTRVTMTLKD